MSQTLNFFKEHPLWDDALHKILSKVPAYEAELAPIRSRMLGCCGAATGKGGKIELTIADPARWDALAAQEAAIMAKLQKIDDMVKELDTILDEVEAAGIKIDRKTPAGIWISAPRTEPPPQRGEYVNAHGKRCDRNGIPLKSQIDPRFLAWNERAEKALREAQAIVGVSQGT